VSNPAAENTKRQDLKPLRALAPFLKPYKLQIAGALVALSVAAGAVLTIGMGLRKLIDQGFSADNPGVLDTALIWLGVMILLLAFGTYGRYFLVTWIGERVVADLRRAVYARVLQLSPAFFETRPTGEVLSRLSADAEVVQTVIGSAASVAMRNFLLVIGGLVLMAISSPSLMGATALAIPLVIAPIVIFGRKVRKLSRENQDRIADVAGHVEESVNAIRIVQAFAQENADLGRFSTRLETAFGTAVRRIRARALLTAVVILLVFGAVGFVLWLGGHRVLEGDMSAGELSAFVFYAIVTAGGVGALSEVWGDLQRAAGATERLTGLLQEEPAIQAPQAPSALPEPTSGALSFNNVSFAYPSRPELPALNAVSFDVAPGETVALVGPSGAGKTTIFQLLLRFYDPSTGQITLNRQDIAAVEPQALRGAYGFVPQEPAIFSATVAENIRFGRPDASDTDVRAAAEAAAALEFIEAMPEGFQSDLGQKGVRLSGGQRQRIAIARAILRDPPILLLDEATSALDSESEAKVQAALDRLQKGRTTLVIAHRLATVQNADRILVLDGGEIAASGAHADLMAADGLYARLATLQFTAG
jgi:ATP-binding cassette subfamily B protein